LNEKTGFLKSNDDVAYSEQFQLIKKEDFVLSAKDLINDQFVLLQSGKKNYFVVRVV
jgi:tyrosyl-tRNA synthetase